MFIVKRNQVIITALVVMIAAAGYLNYIDTKPEEASEVVFTDEDGDMGALVPNEGLTEVNAVMNEVDAAAPVDTEIDIAMSYEEENKDFIIAEDGSNEEDLGAAVFVNSSTDSPYFIQAKLDREQAIAKQKEILVGMINNPNLEQVSKAQCADEMLKIQDRIERESAAEALIKSKGISEVYVRIDETTVDVVVSKEVLSDAEIAQIEDIIKRKTGIGTENIRINTLKK